MTASTLPWPSCGLLLLAALLTATPTFAHSGPVAALSVHTRAGDTQGEDLMLGTSFGVVHRPKPGGAWEIVCSEGIGYDESNRPIIHYAQDGALFVGSPKGLWVSRDAGYCDWTPLPEFGLSGVTSVTADPSNLQVLFVTTGKTHVPNRVRRSDDGGQTFSETVIDGEMNTLFSALRFAPSDPSRVWVSGWYFAPERVALYRSDDGGDTFTEDDVTAKVPGNIDFTLLAVHPTDPDHLLLKGYHPDPAGEGNNWVLYRTVDGGDTFDIVHRDGVSFTHAVFSADGQTVWATNDRLHLSEDGGETWEKRASPLQARCVGEAHDDVLVCSSKISDGWAVASVAPGGELTPLTGFDTLAERQCPEGSSVHTECRPLWSALAVALGAEIEPPDAGLPPDGGSADAGTGEDGGGEGCGCSGGGAALLWFTPLFLALGMRRRRGGPCVR